jgi:hypothetical protein
MKPFPLRTRAILTLAQIPLGGGAGGTFLAVNRTRVPRPAVALCRPVIIATRPLLTLCPRLARRAAPKVWRPVQVCCAKNRGGKLGPAGVAVGSTGWQPARLRKQKDGADLLIAEELLALQGREWWVRVDFFYVGGCGGVSF